MALDLTGYDNEEALREGEFNPPEPGIYHLAVSTVDSAPVSKNGDAIDGIKVGFQVLAGTVAGMEGREFQVVFFYPNPAGKDGGKFATKRLTILGLATEVIDRSQLGQAVDPNWDDMLARHFVAEVEHRKSQTDESKTFPDLKGLHIWHVNHPDAASYPKDAETLEMMPMSWQPEESPQEPPAAPVQAAPKPGAPKPGAPKAGTPKAGTPKPGVARPASIPANKPAAAAAGPAPKEDAYAGL